MGIPRSKLASQGRDDVRDMTHAANPKFNNVVPYTIPISICHQRRLHFMFLDTIISRFHVVFLMRDFMIISGINLGCQALLA